MVKHGGLSIMVWACFLYHGVGPTLLIHGIMHGAVYVNILKDVMLAIYSWEMPIK